MIPQPTMRPAWEAPVRRLTPTPRQVLWWCAVAIVSTSTLLVCLLLVLLGVVVLRAML